MVGVFLIGDFLAEVFLIGDFLVGVLAESESSESSEDSDSSWFLGGRYSSVDLLRSEELVVSGFWM